MYKALYRKYRPVTFDEVCGRDEIIAILKNQIKTDRFAHAYLFCGTRGTGKTTCAKILARAINCLSPIDGNPCGKCSACISMQSGLNTDITEMDAASNNGVGDVRSLIDEIVYTPSELKKRVYIIDEVHMMSQSAFNALLKTLEEPPEHVVFILATTELHKLPATIVSRCQRFDFERIPTQIICDRLRYVAEKENILINDEALFIIAKLSQGGMRDALVYLEMCAGQQRELNGDDVSKLFGLTPYETLISVAEAVCAEDLSTIFPIVEKEYKSSADLSVFWTDLICVYRDLLIAKTTEKFTEYTDITPAQATLLQKVSAKYTKEKLIYELKILNDALLLMQKNPTSKRIFAELAIIKMCDAELDNSLDSLSARISELEDKYSLMGIKRTVEPFISDEIEKEKIMPLSYQDLMSEEKKNDTPAVTSEPVQIPVTTLRSFRKWSEIAEKIKKTNPSATMYLSDSTAYEGENKFWIFFSSPVSLDIANLNRQKICDAIKIQTNGKYDDFSIVLMQKSDIAEKEYNLIDDIIEQTQDE